MVRKTFYSAVLALSLTLTGCGSSGGLLGNIFGAPAQTNTTSNVLGSVLGSVLGGMANSGGGLLGGIFGNALTDNTATSLADMVIGSTRIDASTLAGTWIYARPGVAFTSQNLLAKAGGSVAAGQVKDKLVSAYSSIGIKSDNTGFAFDKNGNFEAYLRGLPLKGTYTLDPSTGSLNLKTSVGTIPAFVTRTANGLAITMESKMLMSVLQAINSMNGNSAINALGNLSKNFDGARLGFDVVKYNK